MARVDGLGYRRKSEGAVALLIAAGVVVWGGATLLIDAWMRERRRRPILGGRLAPYQRSSVADKA